MKKLMTLITLIAMILLSCKQNRTLQDFVKTPCTTLKQISLNGIPEDAAKKMIAKFGLIKATDTNPLPEAIWFSKGELHAIVTLLDAERDTDIAHKNPSDTDQRKQVTDGVRIYFACDTLATNPHNSTSIIIVSTKDDGPSGKPATICFTKRLHLDYYSHCSSSTIFTLGNLNGKTCNGGAMCTGASLYTATLNPSTDSCKKPHSISRATAEGMVQRFGNHSINTTSEWFDLCYLENLDKDPLQNGIRIYFATRDKNNEPNLSLRDAFVIATTIYDSASKTYIDDFHCAPYYPCSYTFINVSGGGGDNGELCPANCTQ